MQRTWQNAILLTLFGAAIATACVVGEDTDGTGDEDGGSGGFGGSSKGGSTAKGGGTAKGGSTGKGGGTSAGGDTGTAGDTGTNGGAPGDAPTCDTANTGGQGGDMVTGTPYPNCDPTDPNDECQTCIQEKCETECMNCNAFEPNNVCGYGGPANYVNAGGEFLCWQECMNEKVDIGAGGAGGGSGLPDASDLTMSEDCLADCATPACDGLPGDETNAITTCVFEQCGDGICIY